MASISNQRWCNIFNQASVVRQQQPIDVGQHRLLQNHTQTAADRTPKTKIGGPPEADRSSHGAQSTASSQRSQNTIRWRASRRHHRRLQQLGINSRRHGPHPIMSGPEAMTHRTTIHLQLSDSEISLSHWHHTFSPQIRRNFLMSLTIRTHHVQ
ncbi:hypothetical protein ACLOJK_004066 [Asimina triloba]